MSRAIVLVEIGYSAESKRYARLETFLRSNCAVGQGTVGNGENLTSFAVAVPAEPFAILALHLTSFERSPMRFSIRSPDVDCAGAHTRRYGSNYDFFNFKVRYSVPPNAFLRLLFLFWSQLNNNGFWLRSFTALFR